MNIHICTYIQYIEYLEFLFIIGWLGGLKPFKTTRIILNDGSMMAFAIHYVILSHGHKHVWFYVTTIESHTDSVS
jgi:hypothetical protein